MKRVLLKSTSCQHKTSIRMNLKSANAMHVHFYIAPLLGPHTMRTGTVATRGLRQTSNANEMLMRMICHKYY